MQEVIGEPWKEHTIRIRKEDTVNPDLKNWNPFKCLRKIKRQAGDG
ncbi:hypothetical protein [Pararobbsia alpina]|uniref:Uncharacterized protein n=1 Tax=Pararobbsia alpina TaxID=621374 RepID=A0A6S7BJI3_9BURK|nr:hypothetical protein LMG28138_04958 [Pararobbsia alpina]